MTEAKIADDLYESGDTEGTYEYLLQFKDSEDPELLWRLTQSTWTKAYKLKKDEKNKMMFAALEYSKRALQFGEENFECHKWYGIMLTETGEILGNKKLIEDSPAAKKHFDKALELCPSDPMSHHLVGMWYYEFANLAWYERKLATLVYGSPPEATFDQALESFDKAEILKPSFYSTNQYMLGMTLLKSGKKTEAKEWFQKVLEFKVFDEEDKNTIEKAKKELKSL